MNPSQISGRGGDFNDFNEESNPENEIFVRTSCQEAGAIWEPGAGCDLLCVLHKGSNEHSGLDRQKKQTSVEQHIASTLKGKRGELPLCPRASLSCLVHMTGVVNRLGSRTNMKRLLHGP